MKITYAGKDMSSNPASFKHHSTLNFQVAHLEILPTSLATLLKTNRKLELHILQQWRPLERSVRKAVIYL